MITFKSCKDLTQATALAHLLYNAHSSLINILRSILQSIFGIFLHLPCRLDPRLARCSGDSVMGVRHCAITRRYCAITRLHCAITRLHCAIETLALGGLLDEKRDLLAGHELMFIVTLRQHYPTIHEPTLATALANLKTHQSSSYTPSNSTTIFEKNVLRRKYFQQLHKGSTIVFITFFAI